MRIRWLLFALILVRCATAAPRAAEGECFMLQALDGSKPVVSDRAECSVKASPASTFKVPHALIALETGVVKDPLAMVAWDGSEQPYYVWKRGHSLDSSMKWSVHARANVEAVKAAMRMPEGAVTMARGTHPFPVAGVVHAKSGNTTVAGERVSWLVGHLARGGKEYVFVARKRAPSALPGTAGADLALRELKKLK